MWEKKVVGDRTCRVCVLNSLPPIKTSGSSRSSSRSSGGNRWRTVVTSTRAKTVPSRTSSRVTSPDPASSPQPVTHVLYSAWRFISAWNEAFLSQLTQWFQLFLKFSLCPYEADDSVLLDWKGTDNHGSYLLRLCFITPLHFAHSGPGYDCLFVVQNKKIIFYLTRGNETSCGEVIKNNYCCFNLRP